MYNITHARRPTHRRSEADARGRAPGRPSEARPRGTCEARRYRVVGGAAEVRGRMGVVDVLPHLRAARTASHERGARELQSGIRGVRTQAPAPQTASRMRHRQGIGLFQLSTETDQPQQLSWRSRGRSSKRRSLPHFAAGVRTQSHPSVRHRESGTYTPLFPAGEPRRLQLRFTKGKDFILASYGNHPM